MWKLDCPRCGKERQYKQYSSYWNAHKQNSVCQQCASTANRAVAPEREQEVVDLHKQGLSNRRISLKLDVSRFVVKEVLAKHDLKSDHRLKKHLEIVADGLARCSECSGVKPIKKFQEIRDRSPKPYRLSICYDCKNEETRKTQAADPKKYLNTRWSRLKQSSARDGIVFSVRREHLLRLYEMQDGKCFYTDLPLSLDGLGRKNSLTLSVDKIEPQHGYVLGNIVLCAFRVNVMKNDVTLDEMKEWMPNWYERVRKFQKETQSWTSNS